MNSMLLKIKISFLLFLGISLQLGAQIPDGYYDSALGKKEIFKSSRRRNNGMGTERPI